jgi:hypothetical protein
MDDSRAAIFSAGLDSFWWRREHASLKGEIEGEKAAMMTYGSN